MKRYFLKGYMKKDVYVKQPLEFECFEFPDYVYELDKALYILKKAPRVWYDRLLKHGYTRGNIDNTLSIKMEKPKFLIVLIYVNDIMLGRNDGVLCKKILFINDQ